MNDYSPTRRSALTNNGVTFFPVNATEITNYRKDSKRSLEGYRFRKYKTTKRFFLTSIAWQVKEGIRRIFERIVGAAPIVAIIAAAYPIYRLITGKDRMISFVVAISMSAALLTPFHFV